MPDDPPDIRVIPLTGDLDGTTDDALAPLTAALAAGAVVIADLAATTYCNLDGLAMLLRASQTATTTGAHLRLAAVPPAVQRLLDLTGASQILPLFPTVDAARQAAPRAH